LAARRPSRRTPDKKKETANRKPPSFPFPPTPLTLRLDNAAGWGMFLKHVPNPGTMQKDSMNVMVTGAAGRLGSAVTKELAAAGHTVSAVDICMPQKREHLKRTVVADLVSREVAYPLMDGIEVLIHLANHPGEVRRDAQTMVHDNVSMNMNVFQAALECGVQRLYFASSIQAFGLSPRHHPEDYQDSSRLLPLRLEDIKPRPRNSYALSKLMSEHMLEYFVREGAQTGVALRFPHLLYLEEKPGYQALVDGKTRLKELASNEGETYLTMEDAARLFAAFLDRDPAGFHVIFPASKKTISGEAPGEVAARCFPGWGRRRDGGLESIVDLAMIKKLVDWEPKD